MGASAPGFVEKFLIRPLDLLKHFPITAAIFGAHTALQFSTDSQPAREILAKR